MSTQQQFDDIRKRLDEATRNLITVHSIVIEALTEKQTAEAFKQAIQCGDFQRLVSVEGDAQQVVYLPFKREQELLARIERMTAALEAARPCVKARLVDAGESTGANEVLDLIENALRS